MSNHKFIFDDEKDSAEGMLSASQINAFLKCRKNWEYSYVYKIKPRVERPYLTIGKLCHVGMAAAWQIHFWYTTAGETPNIEQCIENGINAIQNEYDEYMNENTFVEEEIPFQEQLLCDSKIIFRNAFLRFKPEEWKVTTIQVTKKKAIPAIELHFKLPFKGFKGLHGFIDLIAEHVPTGQTWSIDYKFTKSITENDTIEEAYNLQNTIYLHATKLLGINTVGTITYKHLNTPPSLPKVNQNGTISRAKIKTDWETYAAFCEMNGQNPLDYQEEMQPKLDEFTWFMFIKELRSDETITAIWNEIIIPASKDIKAKTTKYTRSMSAWNCKLCSFTEICQGQLRGYDTDYYMSTVYVKKTYTETEEDNVEEITKGD